MYSNASGGALRVTLDARGAGSTSNADVSKIKTDLSALIVKTALLEERVGNVTVLVGNLVFSSLADAVPIAKQVPGQRYEFFLDIVSLLYLVTDAFTDYAVDMKIMHQAQKAGFKYSQAGKVATSFKTILPSVLAKTNDYDISFPLPAVKHYAAFQNHSADGCVKHKVESFSTLSRLRPRSSCTLGEDLEVQKMGATKDDECWETYQ